MPIFQFLKTSPIHHYPATREEAVRHESGVEGGSWYHLPDCPLCQKRACWQAISYANPRTESGKVVRHGLPPIVQKVEQGTDDEHEADE